MDLTALNQKVNRVFGLIAAWINFVPAFFSSAPQDVTVTWDNANGSTTTQTHPNLRKMFQGMTLITSTSTLDFDNYTEGVFLANLDKPHAPPLQGNFCYVEAIKFENENQVKQVATTYADAYPAVAVRTSYRGVWQPWTILNDLGMFAKAHVAAGGKMPATGSVPYEGDKSFLNTEGSTCEIFADGALKILSADNSQIAFVDRSGRATETRRWTYQGKANTAYGNLWYNTSGAGLLIKYKYTPFAQGINGKWGTGAGWATLKDISHNYIYWYVLDSVKRDTEADINVTASISGQIDAIV